MNTAFVRVLAAVTVVAAAAVLAGPDPVAVAGGLLLAFALPGVALTAVLFRGRDLNAVERVLLAPALSLGLLILSGLVMYAAGIDLDRTAWTSATAGVTLIALLRAVLPGRESTLDAGGGESRRKPALVAANAARAAMGSTAHGMDMTSILPVPPAPGGTTRRLSVVTPAGEPIGVKEREVEENREPDAPRQPRRLVRQLVPLVLAMVLLGAGSRQSYDSSRDAYETTVTALSAAPPGEVNTAGQRTVVVTATGLAADAGPYSVAVVADGGARTDERAVTPTDGSWTAGLVVSGDERVTIGLFRAGEADAYRTVIIAAD